VNVDMKYLPLLLFSALPLALLLALSVPARAETEPAEDLPPGVIQPGTLANPQLIADTMMGLTATAGAIGIKPIEKIRRYLVQLPTGQPGAQVWKERWVVYQGTKSAAIDIRFQEEGSDGVTWSIMVHKNDQGEVKPLPADRVPPPLGGTERQHSVSTAQEFVRQAQAGNVDRMMALTSPQTIRNSGRQQVEESYRKYVVPRFKDATVRWSEFQLQATDETGNRGWDMIGHAEGAETFAFFITVMKEKGSYVVVTLGRHNQDDQTP
jgi:hypothetical protein